MEKQQIKHNIKTIIIKISIAFLVIVALLIYFSGTIDNYLLPHVTVTYSGNGTLKYSLQSISTIEPPKSNSYYSPTAIAVGKVAVKSGMTVNKGDRLVQYDECEFANTRDSLYLSLLRQQNQLDSLYSAYNSAKDDASARSAWSSIQETAIECNMAQSAYDSFVEQFDDEGWILSDRSMTVTKVDVKAGMTVSVGEPLLSYAGDSTAMRFCFTCDQSVENYIYLGSVIDIKASVEAAKDKYVYRSGIAVITEIKETENGFECTAEIKEMKLREGEKMPAYGSEVIISTEFESQPYDHVVMKSAIQNCGYVYLVRKDADGKRFIAECLVTILAESDFYAAVDMTSEPLPIVLTSSKEIHDGQRVIVDG